ncbi:hypothetical protein [Kitasatospora sp. NPDC096140]|uniref:hypothetical protein n=1 Tax=Kitasatospora sp. NPDC096140 TaxID=3155425 RepID=UPI003334A012
MLHAHVASLDIAHYMAGQPLPQLSTTLWLDDEETVRNRQRSLVAARQQYLGTRR